MHSNRHQPLIIYLIIIIIGVFQISTIRKGIDWNGDFSLYIQHAKNIALGTPYEKTGYIYNPSDPMVGPSVFPPIFPLLLSPIYAWYGLNFTAMKIEIISMFLLSLLVFYHLIKQELPFSLVTVVLLVTGFSPFFWSYKDFILSDIPFLMFCYLGLLFIINKNRYTQTIYKEVTYSMFVGLLIYLSYGTRSIGIVAIPCLFIYDIYKIRKISKFAILTTASFLLLFVSQKFIMNSGSSYSLIFSEFTIGTIPNNIFLYTKSFARIWGNGYNDAIAIVIFLVLCTLFVVGYVSKVKNKFSMLEVFLPAYISIVLIFPAFQGVRYLIPVIPLIIFYAFYGTQQVKISQNQFRNKLAIKIFIAAIFISYFSKYTSENFTTINEEIDEKEATELFKFVSTNTKKEDVFIFIKPVILSLFTNRSSAIYHLTYKGTENMDYFKSINAKYIVVINEGSNMHNRFKNYFGLNIPNQLVDNNKSIFKEVFLNQDYKVFKINAFP